MPGGTVCALTCGRWDFRLRGMRALQRAGLEVEMNLHRIGYAQPTAEG